MTWLFLLLLPLGYLLGWASGCRRGVHKSTTLYVETLSILYRQLQEKDWKSARRWLKEILDLHQAPPKVS